MSLQIEKTNNLKKKIYPSYSKLSEIKLISIELASRDIIKQWAEKTLSNGKILGQVTSANTLHHKTFKPLKGGLFCERIFGPLKDFECACGNKQRPNETEYKKILQHQQRERKFCPICDVEYTWSIIRRYQMGYIELVSPVSHIWYLKANPSYLSIILDIKRQYLENIVYCSEILTLENAWKSSQNFGLSLFPGEKQMNPSYLFLSWQQFLKIKKKKEQKLSHKDQKNERKNFLFSDLDNNKIHFDKKPIKRLNNWRLVLNRPSNHFNKTTFMGPMYPNQPNNKSLTLESKNLNSQSITFSNKLKLKKIKMNSKKLGKFEIQKRKKLLNILFQKIWRDFYIFSYKLAQEKNLKLLTQIYPEILSKLKGKALALLHSNEGNQTKSNAFNNKSFHENFKKILKKDKINIKNISLNSIISFFNDLEFFLNCDWKDFNSILKEKGKETTFLEELFDSETLSKVMDFKNQNYFFFLINSKIKSSELPNINKFSSIIKKERQSKFYNKKFSEFVNLLKFSFRQYLLFLNPKEIFNSFNKFKISQNSSVWVDLIPRKFVKKTLFFSRILSNQLSKLTLNDQIQEMVKSFSFLKSQLFEKDNLTKLNERLNSTDLSKKFQTMLKLINKNHKRKWKKKNFKKFLQYYYGLNFNSNFSEKISNKFSVDLFWRKIFIKKENDFRELAPFSFKTKTFKNHFIKINRQAVENSEFIFKKSIFLNFNCFGNQLSLFYHFINLPNLKDKFTQSQVFFKETNFSGLSKEIKSDQLSLKSLNFRKAIFSQIKEKKKEGEAIKNLKNTIYCLSHRHRWKNDKNWQYFAYYTFPSRDFDDLIIPLYKNNNLNSFDFSTENTIVGAGIIQKLLSELNLTELKKMDKQNRILLYELNRKINKFKNYLKKDLAEFLEKKQLKEFCEYRDQLIRRTKLVRKIFRKNSNLEAMILTALPVLPPDLRPILKMQNQIAASDLNRLYQRVIYRNERFKKFLKDPAISNSFEVKYSQRLLQEAVDNLLQNGKSGGKAQAERDSRGRLLKSLSEVLKGKQGRFRQYLLGKRVDYSGRSVIVVGPKLKLHECGLPKEMALELFLPFLIKRILHYNYARTVIGAKTILKNNKILSFKILEEIIQSHPILLNRAPTLHRLGFQAFQPKLVEGRAILLHPLVCPAFNADFDGDQMAVHIPLTVEARAEAWKLMFSRNNLISSSTGDPVILPSQDMVLGLYYLTTEIMKSNISSMKKIENQVFPISLINQAPQSSYFIDSANKEKYFSNFDQIIKAYQLQKVKVHETLWIKWNNFVENYHEISDPYEIRITLYGSYQEIRPRYYRHFDSKGFQINQLIRTTPGRILFNNLINNCKGTKDF